MIAGTLSPPVLAILSALVEEKIGLHYSIADRDLLGDKLAARASEAGFESLLDYYYYLRYDPASAPELDALVDALVVNETYFFREIDPILVAVRDVVRPLCEAGARPRIWSAACSTGEEPLSLAMILAGEGLLDRVEIVASDVSPRVIACARAGRFGVRALRDHVTIPTAAQRFLHTAGERIAVSDEILRAIDFRRINLLDTEAVAALGRFDLILCRNVLIYFHDETARCVVEGLAAALADGGALLVGISESLMRLGTALASEEHRGVFFYRKERAS
ncbi:Chemotaxis protein methyltransferase CheR [Minicystis rosea]|nr:Chemotaxis protein methyltransferase CheR [Minicystis rosea]